MGPGPELRCHQRPEAHLQPFPAPDSVGRAPPLQSGRCSKHPQGEGRAPWKSARRRGAAWPPRQELDAPSGHQRCGLFRVSSAVSARKRSGGHMKQGRRDVCQGVHGPEKVMDLTQIWKEVLQTKESQKGSQAPGTFQEGAEDRGRGGSQMAGGPGVLWAWWAGLGQASPAGPRVFQGLAQPRTPGEPRCGAEDA